MVFFFKQKTAYEMRISDWSSDVCSSDLLRLEKGYRAWSSDIGPDHTPVEAGLAWAVKLKKNIDFKGRAAIEAQVAGGVKKRLACFTVDDPDLVLLGRETIYRDGERVGWLTSEIGRAHV